MLLNLACAVAAIIGVQLDLPANQEVTPDSVAGPVVDTIAEAIGPSTRYVIVAEDHDIDAHRYVSADLLERIAGRYRVIVGLEAAGHHSILDADDVQRDGYLSSAGFGLFLETASRLGVSIFGYDPRHEDYLTYAELAQRGLSGGHPNSRDRRAAETIVALTESSASDLVFLHVGFSHASEVVSQYGNESRGWLAAQLTLLTATDPLTVRLISDNDVDRYWTRHRVQTDRDACELMADRVRVLAIGRGWLGCIPRQHVRRGHSTDFLVLTGER